MTYDDNIIQDVAADEVLEAWRLDLIHRFSPARLIFELADTNIDTEELQAEAERFLRCARIAAWLAKRAASSTDPEKETTR